MMASGKTIATRIKDYLKCDPISPSIIYPVCGKMGLHGGRGVCGCGMWCMFYRLSVLKQPITLSTRTTCAGVCTVSSVKGQVLLT